MTPPGQLHIEELKLAAGQEWSDESGAWRVLRLRSGMAYWLDVTAPRGISEGELVVLAPHLKGTIRASQLGNVVLDWFLFDPHSLCGFFTVTERHRFEHRPQGNGAIQFLPSTHPISCDLATLLERGAPEGDLIQRGETLVLALRVLAQTTPLANGATGRSAAAQDRFHEMISRMPDVELARRTCEDLARLCGCTPRHFNRLFRAEFGESPRARQTELRLLMARRLIDSSDETVAQIAAGCGYRSLSLFNSLFKRRFGISPSEWRQQSSKKEHDAA